jgi:cell division septal protein FtsQ
VAGLLKTMLFVCALVAVLAGFAFLDRYVKQQALALPGSRTIELVGDIPAWIGEEIKNKVYAAAAAEAGNEGVDENAAASVQRSIKQQVPWLADVRVQTTHNSIRISGRWRKPIAVVTAEKNKFFIDSDLVVLDYMPIENLSVVTVTGLEFDKRPPIPGEVWRGDDLAAALAVLSRMERMDTAVCPAKPLLREIDRIDIDNFDGRRKKREPHIVLYTKDNIQIIWGAEIGAWQRHLESPDDDKLAKLYTYYQQHGTLSDIKYINLRDPRQTIYLPVDKY